MTHDRQRSLWQQEFDEDMDIKHHARKSDPSSSHDAARDLVESGRLNQQCREVYDALRRWPHTTSAELAQSAGLDRFLVARRLPDLEKRGLVRKERKRRCLVNGTQAMEWNVL